MFKNSQDDIEKILKNYKNIAVAGLSPNPYRASFDIAKYLIKYDYKVIPVNPNYNEVMGLKCYKSLLDVPDKVELVNVFRRSDQVLPIVEDAIEIGAIAIWMQMGVYNEDAAKLASSAGLIVVMDSCIKIEHSRL